MDDSTRDTYRRAGAAGLALVTEQFHHGEAPTSRFNDLIREHEDPRAVTAAVVGLAVALLQQLDQLQPGSAERFLAAAGLRVENLEIPPGWAD